VDGLHESCAGEGGHGSLQGRGATVDGLHKSCATRPFVQPVHCSGGRESSNIVTASPAGKGGCHALGGPTPMRAELLVRSVDSVRRTTKNQYYLGRDIVAAYKNVCVNCVCGWCVREK
jgi:hypothetical protein